MLAKCFALNPKGPYVSLEKEQNFCVVLTYIRRAREIRKFHVAVVQQWLKNVQNSKLCKCQCKPIVFLLFAVTIVKTPNCCHPEILLPWQHDVTLLLPIIKN